MLNWHKMYILLRNRKLSKLRGKQNKSDWRDSDQSYIVYIMVQSKENIGNLYI